MPWHPRIPHWSAAAGQDDTRQLVALVKDAAKLIESEGETALPDLRVAGSRWRRGDLYVFVVDPEGNMLVHPDPALKGKLTLDLKDINGRSTIRGLIGAGIYEMQMDKAFVKDLVGRAAALVAERGKAAFDLPESGNSWLVSAPKRVYFLYS